MQFLGLRIMLAALFLTLTTGTPLPAVSTTSLSEAKHDLVEVVEVNFVYDYAKELFDVPNAVCQNPPASFQDIKGIEFASKHQFCWFFKSGRCPNDQMPIAVGPGDDLHRTINFKPTSMFCYDPTFKCPGGGKCHNTKRASFDTVGVSFTYPFTNYVYDLPTAQCQAPPPNFMDITAMEFASDHQFCFFYKTNACEAGQKPAVVGPRDDVRGKVDFQPGSMMCYDNRSRTSEWTTAISKLWGIIGWKL
ncbi:hypothetical protein FKW77_010683 [Venturia effusa]|uniref:Uncharacterized protein n=1 Tax=Venturia effusa TaxID=50376 RepID=A0A517KY53_9PEZI|nr:hypothetical protein FKW77_010683 [Venturia effusa]